MSDQPTPRYQHPLVTDPMRWGSLQELSRLLGRSYIRIYFMAVRGDLADFGIASFQDSRGRWWVQLPTS